MKYVSNGKHERFKKEPGNMMFKPKHARIHTSHKYLFISYNLNIMRLTGITDVRNQI
jgi:hypothetical protein